MLGFLFIMLGSVLLFGIGITLSLLNRERRETSLEVMAFIGSAVGIFAIVAVSIAWGITALDCYTNTAYLTERNEYLKTSIATIDDAQYEYIYKVALAEQVSEYNIRLSECITAETIFPMFSNYDLDYLTNTLGYIYFVVN